MKMQINVEIKDAAVRSMSGVAKRTGKPYELREQSGWVDLGKPYPLELRWLLGDGKAPLPVGKYVLDESAVYIDRNGSLQINARSMKPVAAAAAASLQAARA